MEREIERKFYLVSARDLGPSLKTTELEQGYVRGTGDWELRLRRSGNDTRLTLKSAGTLDRAEWETTVPAADFERLWPQTEGQRLAKARSRYAVRGSVIEVDTFHGPLDGLVTAEVEFPDAAAARAFAVPKGFGPELTYDPRFKNRALAASRDLPPVVPPSAKTPGWSYGVLPFHKGPNGWELLIVSARGRDRWLFPKGQPEPGKTPAQVAVLEAREEAGATGTLVGHPLVLPYPRDTGLTNLLLHPFRVTRLATRWLEASERERRLIPLDQAANYGPLIAGGAQWLKDWLGVSA